MATELTVKERAFARLVIEGTKTAAYRTVYSANGSPATQAVNAYKISKRPKIKKEVARLLRQRECAADDYARIRDMAVAGLTEMFIHEPDPRIRAKAGSILLAYADAGLKLHPVPSEKERKYDELVEILRNTFVGREPALHELEPPLVEETPPDPPLKTSSSETLEAGESWESYPVANDATVVAGASAESGLKGLAPEATFELVPVPGAFPVRFRRVPVP